MTRLILNNANGKNSTYLLLLTISIVLSGCGTNMKAIHPDPTAGLYPTGTKVSPTAIKIKEHIPVKEYVKLLYIRQSVCPGKGCTEFVKQSLVNLQIFQAVKDKYDIQREIVQEGLSNSTLDVSDEMLTGWLRHKVGNFLIADYSVRWAGEYDWIFDVRCTTSDGNETVLQIFHKGFNFSGLDQPLFYPVFNAIKEWINENSKL